MYIECAHRAIIVDQRCTVRDQQSFEAETLSLLPSTVLSVDVVLRLHMIGLRACNNLFLYYMTSFMSHKKLLLTYSKSDDLS